MIAKNDDGEALVFSLEDIRSVVSHHMDRQRKRWREQIEKGHAEAAAVFAFSELALMDLLEELMSWGPVQQAEASAS